MQLRDYQVDISDKATTLLKEYKIAYLCMEVRTGKTLTALKTADNYGVRNVLFLTKKKAIQSIQFDYDNLRPSFKCTISNYEQLHNCGGNYDLFICDEAHCLGQFPIPAGKTKLLKKLVGDNPVIFLSGTPTPETKSQLFHQLYISNHSPFKGYKNFYRWAADFVKVGKKYFFRREINDYSNANEGMINEQTSHLFLTFTQAESGFTQDVNEHIIYVDMQPSTYTLADRLRRDRVVISKTGHEILADTEVKLMQKLHQIYSGTVKNEQGTGIVFDNSKINYIKQHFSDRKIAIFYKFIAEGTQLISLFGDKLTLSPEDFNNSSDKIFFSQISSGREGINLSTADCLVMLNIDFSAVSYWQARGRIQAKERVKPCLLYWLFSRDGIEPRIYKAVKAKKNYTLSYFKKDYRYDRIVPAG